MNTPFLPFGKSEHGLLPRPRPPVKPGLPFIGEFRSTKGGGEGVQSAGKWCRDQKGRIRIDHIIGDTRISIIHDTQQKQVTIFSPSHDLFIQEEVDEDITSWMFRSAGPVRFSEDRREILSVMCNRVVFIPPGEERTGQSAGHAWVSKELALVLEDEDLSEDMTWQMTRLSLTEPDPALFNISPNYLQLPG